MNLDRDLEASLQRVMGPKPDADDNARRLLARLDAMPLPAQKRRLLAAWWPVALTDMTFAPAWPRLAALACAAALGISVGLSGLGARIAADLDLVRSAQADETSTNIFETDSLTGLRR
jgi:hypothetical protein